MSIEAFGTRRVTESLKAIAKYLDDGARLARGVPPGQGVTLQLDDPPVTLSPRLTKVLWDLGYNETSSSIHIDDLDLTQDPVISVFVSGVDLLDAESSIPIAVFRLVGQGTGTRYFEAAGADISLPSATAFKAALHLIPTTTPEVPPPIGPFDALVVNKLGQAFLLANAVSIEPSESFSVARTSGKGSAASASASRQHHRKTEKT